MKPVKRRQSSKVAKTGHEPAFREIIGFIESARQRAFQAVNTELIDLYWRVGKYISRKLKTAAWGEGVVDELAKYIARHHADIKGFTRTGLFRMRQFFDTYHRDAIVAPLVRQLSWSHNLLILGRCKRSEEREFYVRLCLRERWGKRDLERQLRGALFERTILTPAKMSAVMKQVHPAAEAIFKDTYLLDFLDLPDGHSEDDLQRGLVNKLKQFLLELGRDFTFMGQEYLLPVGQKDYRIDLLFYHRGLQSMVAFELKLGDFEPEYLGRMEFCLEVLDRDLKKPHERPSIGVLLCATRDRKVVEYALNRSMSPALIAEYSTRLPSRQLLRRKLNDFYQLTLPKAASRRKRSKEKTAVNPLRAR